MTRPFRRPGWLVARDVPGGTRVRWYRRLLALVDHAPTRSDGRTLSRNLKATVETTGDSPHSRRSRKRARRSRSRTSVGGDVRSVLSVSDRNYGSRSNAPARSLRSSCSFLRFRPSLQNPAFLTDWPTANLYSFLRRPGVLERYGGFRIAVAKGHTVCPRRRSRSGPIPLARQRRGGRRPRVLGCSMSYATAPHGSPSPPAKSPRQRRDMSDAFMLHEARALCSDRPSCATTALLAPIYREPATLIRGADRRRCPATTLSGCGSRLSPSVCGGGFSAVVDRAGRLTPHRPAGATGYDRRLAHPRRGVDDGGWT